MASASDGTESTQNISSQLAYLVPTFDPSKDDLQVYQQKVQLVHAVWPKNKVSELITRLILNTTGSAFAKLQLHHEELCVNDEKGVKKLIELLGGHWGRLGLEKKYSDAKRALFQCNQQADESHDSYLAIILWTKLQSQKLKLEDLQAYITLRGALLTSDDKKRVILESDSSLEGRLTVPRVQEAIRLLGTSFFQEMTGLSKKAVKTKVYDHANIAMDDTENQPDADDFTYVSQHDEMPEDEMIETLVAEGDEDACFVADFEQAASELVQNDPELAAAYSTYVEARKKLSEKVKARGFWPIKGQGRGKGFKGKFKSKTNWSSRKSLQQRIMETSCRLCGKKGHWKNNCPMRQSSASSASQSAPVTLSVAAADQSHEDVMPMEFMMLPEITETPAQDCRSVSSECFVQTVFFQDRRQTSVVPTQSASLMGVRDRIRTYIKGNKENNSKVASLVSRIESRMRRSEPDPTKPRTESNAFQGNNRFPKPSTTDAWHPKPGVQFASEISPSSCTAEAMFSTHDTWGIIDTGATKTVIGSSHVADLLKSLDPSVKDQVKRCKCDVVFRFGNQGTLKSEHAIMIPLFGLGLKIAIVPGTTPFLLSNTLLRALGASIDTGDNVLKFPKHQITVPLKLSPKGLYLVDMNQLIKAGSQVQRSSGFAETFAQESETQSEKFQVEPPAPEDSSGKAEAFEPEPAQMHRMFHEKHQHVNHIHNDHHVTLHGKEVNHNSQTKSFQNQNIATNTEASCQCPKIPIVPKPISPSCHHERLDSEIGQSASLAAAGDSRGDRPLVHRGAEVGGHDIRKDPSGSNVRGCMELQSRVDTVVPAALPKELQACTPKDDSVHQAQDRSHGGEPHAGTSITGVAKRPCSTQGHALAYKSKGSAEHHDVSGRDGTATGRTEGGLRKCSDLKLAGTYGSHGERLAPDPGPSSSCSDDDQSDTRALPNHAGRGRVERSLESVKSDMPGCDLALAAGEIDSFCESIPNQERAMFWKWVRTIESELETVAQ